MMPNLFNNKYRIPSARLQNWDYASEAMYFVTICTKNRLHYFGHIDDSVLQPTEIGNIACSEWYKSVELRPDMNLELGEFVVMPNHIHGIISIGANEYNSGKRNGNGDENGIGRDAMHGVSTITDNEPINDNNGLTTNENPIPQNHPEYKNKFAPQSKNLSSIIRGYKSAVTTYARKNVLEFDWQSRFHDHIIRNSEEYHRISNYILNNPAKWQKDKFLNNEHVLMNKRFQKINGK